MHFDAYSLRSEKNAILALNLDRTEGVDCCTLSQVCCFLLDPSNRAKHCKNTYYLEKAIILINIFQWPTNIHRVCGIGS